jgi:ribosomal protein S18 acetylase RimI-like enzyme/putative sterol carrier protein
MQIERMRILVDRSRDAGWSDALIDIEPDDVYQVTDNRDYLKWSVLKNYDVLTMCGYPIIPYKDEEIRIIKKFVELGGGFLLASSTGRFERDVGKPISEMQLNKIAKIFGAEFLPFGTCKAEIKSHNHVRGYPGESLYLADRSVFADLYLEDIPFSNCGIILIPDGADVVIHQNETLEPVGACINFRKGRVMIINEVTFSQRSRRTCCAFLDWLGRNRFSKVSGDERIPDEIPVDEYTKENGNIEIFYNSFVPEDRVDTCLRFAKKISEYMISTFPDNPDRKWKINLAPSCTYERTSMWKEPIKGAFMSDQMLAYAVGAEGLMRSRFLRSLAHNVFDPQNLSEYCGIMAMRLLGFENEADRIYLEIVKQFKEKDPTGTEIDATKTYRYHPKLTWVLTSLSDKYGHDFFARLQKNIPKPDEFWNQTPYYKPHQVFSPLDIFIYYLSLTLGEDMYPWFRKIGTTVHELPLYKEDTDEFKKGVRQYLKNVIKDKSASASDRDDAIKGLIYVYDKEKYDFALDDKYDCIVSGIKLAHSCDNCASEVLRELANDEDDPAISAIASLALVQLGDTSNAEQLIDIAKSLDYRFQLNVSHVFSRIGYNFCEKKPVTEIEYDGSDLKVYVTVEGHRVAHVFSIVDCETSHFPNNTHTTGVYVSWVSTEPKYRRIGISSLAMSETFSHPSMRRCSYTVLTTGIENPAHAMYRSFGFVDQFLMETFNFSLREEIVNVPNDFVLRSYVPGDELRMAELANECYSNSIGVRRAKALRKSDSIIKIAERNGEILGYVFAPMPTSRDEVELTEICLKNTDERHKIGLILLRSLHNDLLFRGFDRIVFWSEFGNKEDLRGLLSELGYSSRLIGGVKMFKLINLPMLLEEITPLLAKRLMNSDYKDWRGRIGISGNQHEATIIVEDEISIAEEVMNGLNIHLQSDDDTITRIAIGRLTPYEAYLQRELTIKPIVNDRVANLLKTLFPKIPE